MNDELISKGKNIFQKYVNPDAVDFCVNLWYNHEFILKITKPRKSIRGNFIFNSKENRFIITINGDLNPYSFLFTFLHEVAHLITFKKFGNQVFPHGKEWKKIFSELLIEAYTLNLFPKNIDSVLVDFLANPKATVNASQKIETFFSSFDVEQKQIPFLKDLENGSVFYFQQKKFKKIKLRRTRVLCLELDSAKNYLISAIARVRII
jgi:hypothetical protein